MNTEHGARVYARTMIYDDAVRRLREITRDGRIAGVDYSPMDRRINEALESLVNEMRAPDEMAKMRAKLREMDAKLIVAMTDNIDRGNAIARLEAELKRLRNLAQPEAK